MNVVKSLHEKSRHTVLCLKALFISIALPVFASGTTAATIRCETPLADYDSSLLENIGFFGESSVPKTATPTASFGINCASGYLRPKEQLTLDFHDNGVIKSAVVGVPVLMVQDQALLYLPESAEVEFSRQGLMTAVHGVSPSSVRIAGQEWPIAETVNFNASGSFYSGEIYSKSAIELEYFGDALQIENSDVIIKTADGGIFPEKATPSLVGHWTLENRQGNLKIRIAGDGNGEYMVFLLRGDPSVLKASMRDELLRAGVAITDPFFLGSQPTTNINLKGIVDVPNPNGEGTVSKDVISQAELAVSTDQLTLKNHSMGTLVFYRDGWLQTAANLLQAVFQASIAFVLFSVFFLVGLYGLRRQSSVLVNARFDRRYRDGRLRGGGTMQGIFIIAAVWLGASMFGYYSILNYFKIGGFFDFMRFFLY